ncbi:MAG: tRNA (adenine-N1)-methyltransferase, partial [Acidimicrobiia bacterium]|nr:tRNA (adenine-N1)-methyltransferase [Acidimicrobiia bacterium]
MSNDAPRRAGDPLPIGVDETVILSDDRGKQFLVRLDVSRSFAYHRGELPHSEIIGRNEGETVTTSGDGSLLILRPRLTDFIMKMKRGAQIVYPKDIGPILVYADIGPGMTVV